MRLAISGRVGIDVDVSVRRDDDPGGTHAEPTCDGNDAILDGGPARSSGALAAAGCSSGTPVAAAPSTAITAAAAPGAAPIAVNCGPGQQALIRPGLIAGQAISQVDCVPVSGMRARHAGAAVGYPGVAGGPVAAAYYDAPRLVEAPVVYRPAARPVSYRTAPRRGSWSAGAGARGRRARSSSARRPASAPASAGRSRARRARCSGPRSAAAPPPSGIR